MRGQRLEQFQSRGPHFPRSGGIMFSRIQRTQFKVGCDRCRGEIEHLLQPILGCREVPLFFGNMGQQEVGMHGKGINVERLSAATRRFVMLAYIRIRLRQKILGLEMQLGTGGPTVVVEHPRCLCNSCGIDTVAEEGCRFGQECLRRCLLHRPGRQERAVAGSARSG